MIARRLTLRRASYPAIMPNMETEMLKIIAAVGLILSLAACTTLNRDFEPEPAVGSKYEDPGYVIPGKICTKQDDSHCTYS